jgi:HSP20 family protein
MALSPFAGFERDPFAALRRFQQEMDRVFEPVRGGAFPPVNMWQGPDSAALTAELPGIDPGSIDVSVKEDLVTIAGERRPPADDNAAWHRRERAYGRFSRVVQLPFRVDPDRIEARMQDGVLQIELHRPETDKPRRISIKTE